MYIHDKSANRFIIEVKCDRGWGYLLYHPTFVYAVAISPYRTSATILGKELLRRALKDLETYEYALDHKVRTVVYL